MLHARLLSYLDEVVRQGSIRKAADRLNVAPSAISRQILNLEEDMGVALFDRSGRRLVPTAAGELLIRHVRDTQRDLARTKMQIEELKGLRRGHVRIGLMSGLADNIVPKAAVRFHEQNPRVDLDIQLKTTGEEILDGIEAGDLELGLGFDFERRQGVRLVHACIGRLGAVMRPDHPLAGESELRLADCVSYPLALANETTAIRPYLDHAFTSLSLDFSPLAQSNSIGMLSRIASESGAICFLTPYDVEAAVAEGRLVYIPLHEFARHTQRIMLIENARKPSPIAGVFSEILKSAMNVVDTGGLTTDADDVRFALREE